MQNDELSDVLGSAGEFTNIHILVITILAFLVTAQY